MTATNSGASLRVLAVDDELPSLSELVYLLRSLDDVSEVVEAHDANEALRALRSETFDAVFLDVRMPGLDGIELARVLRQFKVAPPVVFVTAFEDHAVDAFEIDAVDYLLKPVRAERLAKAVNKVAARRSEKAAVGQHLDPRAGSLPSPEASIGMKGAGRGDDERDRRVDETISIEVAGRIRLISRRDVRYVAASGDYVRLHLADSSVLIRIAISALEEKWSSAGFVRIHRGYLVALSHIDEVRVETGRGYTVRIGDRSLPVSRRLASQLRERLVEDVTRRNRS